LLIPELTHIESRWDALKKSLPRHGTTKDLYQPILQSIVFVVSTLTLQEFLRLLGTVSTPPTVKELVPAQVDITSNASY